MSIITDLNRIRRDLKMRGITEQHVYAIPFSEVDAASLEIYQCLSTNPKQVKFSQSQIREGIMNGTLSLLGSRITVAQIMPN
jgi:hypothetical protein